MRGSGRRLAYQFPINYPITQSITQLPNHPIIQFRFFYTDPLLTSPVAAPAGWPSRCRARSDAPTPLTIDTRPVRTISMTP
jgi:hypothetical protein